MKEKRGQERRKKNEGEGEKRQAEKTDTLFVSIRLTSACYFFSRFFSASFLGNAVQRIEEAPITQLIVTNSIQLSEATKKCTKIKIIDVGMCGRGRPRARKGRECAQHVCPGCSFRFFHLFRLVLGSMLAETIRRTHNGESISVLFHE